MSSYLEMEDHKHGMDMDKEPAREDEEDNRSLKLVWEGEDEEMLEEEVEEVLEDDVDEVLEKEVDDQGGDQQPVLPSLPGQLLLRRSERKPRATLLREEQEAYEAKLLVADDAQHGGEGWLEFSAENTPFIIPGTVFMGGLGMKVGEEQLEEIYSMFGKVEKVVVVVEKDGERRPNQA